MTTYKSILTRVEEGPDGLRLRTLTDDERRLIAAAPALLAACEAVAAANAYGDDVPDWYENDRDWIINAEAARLVAAAIKEAQA